MECNVFLLQGNLTIIKGKQQMKRLKISVLLVLSVLFLSMASSKAVYASNNPYYDLIKKYQGKVTDQEYMQLEVWSSYMPDYYQEFYDGWICSGAIGRGSEGVVTEILLKEGYYTEYFDQIKAAGLVSPDFQLPSSATKTDNNSAKEVGIPVDSTTSIPKEVTTNKCDEKIMWAKSQVNVRENGSTDYKKVGSLQANEQVTVTGIDSTGWYEIRMADGTVGHVSDKYLTEEDPSSNVVPEEKTNEEAPKRESEIISIDGRTVLWYNAETDKEEEFVFDENVPLEDVENLAVKHLINGEEIVEPEKTEEVEETEAAEVIEEPVPVETSEEIKEELVQEEPAETEELEVSEPQEKADETQGEMQTPIIVFVCVLVCLIVVAGIVVMIKAKKKE